MKNEINLLFVSNAKYLKYLSVLLNSIYMNNYQCQINVWIFYSEGEREERRTLELEMKEKGIKLYFVEPSQELFDKNMKVSSCYPIETYYTLFPHLLLPSGMKRILYLDIDMIVNGSLLELYNLEFGDNYLIAAGHAPDFQITNEKLDEEKKKRGGYFNSGMIVYNLEKMRKEISIKDYSYVLSHSDEFFFDQGMLNYLFAEKTKYVNTLMYNFRVSIKHKYPQNNEVPTIIHYIISGTPYKPWDCYFTESELKDIGKAMPKYNGDLNMFYIDKEINNMVGIWWNYAKHSAFYCTLDFEMKTKKEYILRLRIPDRINSNYKKINNSDEYMWNRLYDKKIMESHMGRDNVLCSITDCKQYFNFLANEKYFILICVKDGASRYWEKFNNFSGLNLSELKYREGGCACVNNGKTLMFNKGEKSYIEKNFDIKRRDTRVILENVDASMFRCKMISQGYDEKNKSSYAAIYINNVNFSLNKIGINIVVIDSEKMEVIDSININSHADEELKINR